MSGEDLATIDRLHQHRRKFQTGVDLVHQGQADQATYILAKGWACSYKTLPNGTRQIVDFQIPCDFLGLRSVLFRTADHNIEPVTPVEASEVIITELLDAFAHTPRLATAVLWAASRDEAMVVEHLVNIGRRNALERTAHYLLEFGARLKLMGLATRTGYDCPLSQYMLADVLGLSAVHVNRVLRQLREMGFLILPNALTVAATAAAKDTSSVTSPSSDNYWLASGMAARSGANSVPFRSMAAMVAPHAAIKLADASPRAPTAR